jgi:hypothetical protein
MKLSQSTAMFVKGAISTVGIFSVCVLGAGSAAAENASVSGAVTYTRPAGFSISYSAEKVAPAGFQFTGAVTVQATLTGPDTAPIGMMLDAGNVVGIGATATTGPVTLKNTVITELTALDVTKSAELDAYSAILKAAAGTDGLE